MEIKRISLNTGANKAALAALCVVCVAAIVLFAKWAFGHVVAVNATEPKVAELGASLTASDPQAHYELAGLLEKTLLPGDQERSLGELELVVSLSPHNYVYWLALARAREQSGDSSGAEEAARTAQGLAPNYSRVQWALGNVLLRQGRLDEGFAEIRKAVAAEATFAGPAAAAAWQLFGGDVGRITEAIGDSPRINAAIALLLANDKRYQEAISFWKRVPIEDIHDEVKEAGMSIFHKLVEGGRYRSAIDVAAGAFADTGVLTGSVSNPGFEEALTESKASGPFSWKIADGAFPRVGQNQNQKRSGEYSLLISFGNEGTGFRQITQKVGVEPLGKYDLQFFYRSELTTAAKLRCDVYSPDGSLIAGTALNSGQNWGTATVSFIVPADTEGIDIRIGIDSCPATGCTAAGNIWFDDFSLSRQ
ncbi:MAG: tetratricopeptide repeat protein [Pyrinomonadaceae bacterium]